MKDDLSPITQLLHQRSHTLMQGDAAALPIYASSTFISAGDPKGAHYYSRNHNPTVEAVEASIGIIENAPVLLFSTGMAAVAAVFHATLKSGDTVLVHADGYYNVRGLLAALFEPNGIQVRTAPMSEMLQADFSGVRLVFAETPTNPTLEVCDLRALAERSHAVGAVLAVDNTTPTPLCQRPLDLGADVSVMADTKAMAGHSDILAGHVASRHADLMERVRRVRTLGGATLSPFEAYLLDRGLQTLELRIARQNANALAVAELLRAHPAVLSVSYPGLSNDPAHDIARRQMTGFGPIVSFTVKDRATAEDFIARHRCLVAATSFGGTHSSAECRIRWGDAVPEGFVRLACGIEPTADMLNETRRALDAIRP